MQKLGLLQILELTREKFDYTSKSHIIKSLVYFEDAEDNPEPILLHPVSWDAVKDYISEEVRKLML